MRANTRDGSYRYVHRNADGTIHCESNALDGGLCAVGHANGVAQDILRGNTDPNDPLRTMASPSPYRPDGSPHKFVHMLASGAVHCVGDTTTDASLCATGQRQARAKMRAEATRGTAPDPNDGTTTSGANPFAVPQQARNPSWQVLNPPDPYAPLAAQAPYKPSIEDSVETDSDGYLLALMLRGDTPGITKACEDLIRARHLPAPKLRRSHVRAAEARRAAPDGYLLALGFDNWSDNNRGRR